MDLGTAGVSWLCLPELHGAARRPVAAGSSGRTRLPHPLLTVALVPPPKWKHSRVQCSVRRHITVSKHRVTVLMVLGSVGRFVSLSGGAGAAALCRVRRFGQGSAAAFWKGPKSTRFRLRGPHVVLCFYKLVKLRPLLACSLCRPSHGVHSAV